MLFEINVDPRLPNMQRYLESMQRLEIRRVIEPIAVEGVRALAAATPQGDEGKAASSWGYRIEVGRESVSIIWTNDDIENGFPVVIALQYGYATGTGGYVQGRDFINPALRTVFDRFSREIGRAVTIA